MLLTIDVGNTRTKWAVFNKNGVITHCGACLNDALASADLSPTVMEYERVIISNVAGEQLTKLLADKFAPYTLPVRWIKSSLQACNVHNLYTSPETLGSDRWAALIAAWHIKQTPCIVVNAGTAVTIDAMNIHHIDDTALNMPSVEQLPVNDRRGEFMGGLILPGLHLMQQSLALATAQLPAPTLNTINIADTFSKNTANAIYAGAVHAIVGAITLMTQSLHEQCQQVPSIIISGGNAKTIHDHLIVYVTNHVLIIDNLVLQGLYLLDNFMSTNSTQSESQ